MDSISTYQGRLAVDGDPLVLVVDLRFEDENLELCTSRESLGRWPLTDVRVSQLDSGIFSLHLGSETALFAADDPIGFAQGVIPSGNQGRHSRAVVSRNQAVGGRST